MQVIISIVNTTQTYDVALTNRTQCSGDKCTVTIEATPGMEFCSSVGRPLEYINLRLNIETVEEEINIKYHVPCACECSQKLDIRSSMCNFHGDYSCGVCFCQSGW